MDSTILFSLKSLYSREGEVDYERVKEIARRIVSGTSRIVRLDDREERGRILGGQRNVEASLIAAASEGADREGFDQSGALQRSEETLEAYAKHEGIWFDFQEDLDASLSLVAEGFEAYVYKPPDEPFVIKAARFAASTPLETLDERITLFNYLFPETAYELEGFTRDPDGNFRFVLRQPFIIGEIGEDDPRGLASRMREAGLFATTNPENFESSNHSVRDVHNLNYVKSGARVFIIDAITSLNSPANGGKREYQPFRVESVISSS